MEFRIFHIHKRKTPTQFSIFPWQWSTKTINSLRFVAWTIVILVPPFVSIHVEQKKDSASLASRNCACQKTDDCPASGPSCLATRHFPSLIFANAWANIIGSPLESRATIPSLKLYLAQLLPFRLSPFQKSCCAEFGTIARIAITNGRTTLLLWPFGLPEKPNRFLFASLPCYAKDIFAVGLVNVQKKNPKFNCLHRRGSGKQCRPAAEYKCYGSGIIHWREFERNPAGKIR